MNSTNPPKTQTRRRFVLLSALAALAIGAQPLLAQEKQEKQDRADDIKQLSKLSHVYQYITDMYVDTADPAPLVESAIVGMLEKLDPHSEYITADEMQTVEEIFDGEFSGIGVEFNVLRDTVIVANTISGGPAERVGVARGSRSTSCATASANRSTL